MECIGYGDHRLLSEAWVDQHQKEYYREDCSCETCSKHRLQARRKGRCSEFCTVCFDGIWSGPSGKPIK